MTPAEPDPPLNPLERRLIAAGLRDFTDPTLATPPPPPAQSWAEIALLQEWCEKLIKGDSIDPDAPICCGGGTGYHNICGCNGQTYKALAHDVLAQIKAYE